MIKAAKRKGLATTLRFRRLVKAPADAMSATRLREEQFAVIKRNTPGMLLVNICNALVILVAFRDTPQLPGAALWAGLVCAAVAAIRLRSGGRRAGPRAAGVSEHVCRRATLNALLLGALWSAPLLLLFPEAGEGVRLLIACITAGMLFGGVFALASAPVAAIVFATPIAFGGMTALLRRGDPDEALIAFVLGTYVFALLRGVVIGAERMKVRLLTQIRAERQARTDPLTDLPNRLGFNDAVEREFARLKRAGKGFLLLCVDLDDFKLINDRLGHPAGDELLVQAAQRMRVCLRACDIVARLGGDEFAILAVDIDSQEDAALLASRIIACFATPFQIEGQEVYGAASVGGALAPRDGDDFHQLVKSADIALYRAKEHGGCWRLFEPVHDAAARALEIDLSRAVSQRQLALVYQPILNLATNDIVGCEALLRWAHPTRGPVDPQVFIPLAEKIGLIHEIGLWAAESACATAARLPDQFRIALNISPAQLHKDDFAERMIQTLAAADVAPARIEIEIAETALLADDGASDASIRKLSRAGLNVSLDDFGSGYSSLSYLRKLPLNKVKIDSSFIGDVLARKDCAAIVIGLTRMAGDLGMTIVAEGVETAAQLDWLRRVGCFEAQGYLIGAPMPEADLARFLANGTPERLAPAQRARA